MATVIDRGSEGSDDLGRQIQTDKKFKRKELLERVREASRSGSIKDLADKENHTIQPTRGRVLTPQHDQKTGQHRHVHPGNPEGKEGLITGDQIPRPKGGQGGGAGTGQAGQDGEGQDEFNYNLSQKEFEDLFFEDLELPNLKELMADAATAFKRIRAGFRSDGAFLSPVRFKKKQRERLIATGNKSEELKDLEKKMHLLEAKRHGTTVEERLELRQLHKDIEALKEREAEERKARIARGEPAGGQPKFEPYYDTKHAYLNHAKQPVPVTQAVMFCLMDVSGSMDEERKGLAKRFFTLLYLFLRRNYQRVVVVFIRHHTVAKEVDEEEFFYSRETGGTMVSTCFQLMGEIQKERFPTSSWNIYAAQASDGDNWGSDNPIVQKLVEDVILPLVQFFVYVEVGGQEPQNLWKTYKEVEGGKHGKKFAMRAIKGVQDVWKVFRDVFRKQQDSA